MDLGVAGGSGTQARVDTKERVYVENQEKKSYSQGYTGRTYKVDNEKSHIQIVVAVGIPIGQISYKQELTLTKNLLYQGHTFAQVRHPVA